MYFIKNVKPGDILWFVKSKSDGLLIGVAKFKNINERQLGPLICVTRTNEELGWTNDEDDWDTEVHYTDLYNISKCNLLSKIKGAATIRKNSDKCNVDLQTEYANIIKYSNIKQTFQ